VPLSSKGIESIFKNYSISEGLVHKSVKKIIQDSEGFIWIATTNGISRFDGYEFKNFTCNDNDSTSLSGATVVDIEEGNNGKIWLSTEAGLEYYDKKHETFHLVDSEHYKGDVFTRRICVDKAGIVWSYEPLRNIVAYDPRGDSLFFSPVNIPALVDTAIVVLNFIEHDEVLWLACNKGIACFDYKSDTFEWIEESQHTNCPKIQKMDSCTLTMTFTFEGICTINTHTQKISWITKDFIGKKIGAPTVFFDAVTDNNGTIYIAVSPGLVAVKDSVVRYYNSHSEKYYFEGNSFANLFRDNSNNIWIGTYEDGIFLKKEANKGFQFREKLHADDVKRTRISNFHVFSNNTLLYDDTESIYFCKDYNNLYSGCATRIMTNQLSLIFPLDKRYCIVNIADSAFLYDSQSRLLTYSHQAYLPASACKDSNGILWTSTWDGTLIGFDKAQNKRYEIIVDKNKHSRTSLFSICNDVDGSIWMGSYGKGLVHVVNPTDEKPIIEFYNKKGKGMYFLNTSHVHCLHLDASNNLWIGTNGNGLIKRNALSKKFEVFTTQNGLKSDVIESIVSDNNGNIWFASSVISKYDVQQKVFTHYLQNNGIEGTFIVKACAKATNGDLLFASSRGIYILHPSLIKKANDAPTPIFTDFKIRGKSVNAGDSIYGTMLHNTAIIYSKEICLPYELNSFSIVFASLDYQAPKIFDYQFKLNGVDNDWVSSNGSNRIARYVGIQPGSYLFSVRASNGSGEWSLPRTIEIIIIPPWWKTIWFKITMLLFILGTASAIIAFRFRNVKQRNKELEQKVKQRTNRLSEANMLLQESHLYLEMKNEQTEEALSTKDKLIQVIAHDFKNPLAALLGNLSNLKERFSQYDKEMIFKTIDSISISGKSLLMQMNNVLDWALSEKKKVVFRSEEVNIETLVIDSIELVKESAERKNIFISTHSDYKTNALVDSRMIGAVIRNLLVNAIKFTPHHGTIVVVVQEYDDDIEVSVIDSGVGVSQDFINAILQSGKSSIASDTDNIKSTGIGLQLCKLFIDKNKGKFSIRSDNNRGSVFSFTVPKGEHDAVKPQKTHLSQNNKKDSLQIPIPEDFNSTILIIDDNESILTLLKQLLEPYYSVVTANDGKSGMQMASNVVPSLIISDIAMPSISGIDLCQALKENDMTNKTPIILLTANRSLMNEGYACGADDFIVKPFNENELLMKVHALLENRKRIVHKRQEHITEGGFILPESFDDAIINKLLTYINTHFCDNELDISTIISEIGLGRTQLWRKFKESTGQNLSEYIRNLRLSKANEMLKTGKYKVAEVGYEVGFTNPQYFSRCFAKHMGYTPSEVVSKKK